MPWKFIAFLIVLVLFVFFIGLNIENRADISFGFTVFSQVPIFISLFSSFVLGVLVTLPFTLFRKTKKPVEKLPKPPKKSKKTELPESNEKTTLT